MKRFWWDYLIGSRLESGAVCAGEGIGSDNGAGSIQNDGIIL